MGLTLPVLLHVGVAVASWPQPPRLPPPPPTPPGAVAPRSRSASDPEKSRDASLFEIIMKNDQALQTHLKSDRFPAGGGVPVRQDRRLPDQLRLRRPGQETERKRTISSCLKGCVNFPTSFNVLNFTCIM